MYTYICVYISLHICIYIHIHLSVCSYVCVMYISCTNDCLYKDMHMDRYMLAFISGIRMYVLICIYILHRYKVGR